MQPSRAMQVVVDFCLEHAEEAPVRRRVLLYRGLAEFCADDAQAALFRKLSDDLEALDLRCREFAFSVSNPRNQSGAKL